RTLGAQLDNRGTVTVGAPFTLNKTSGAHLNSGTFDLSTQDMTLTQNGTTPSFTTTGTITIGAGHTLSVNGGTFSYNGGTIGGAGLGGGSLGAGGPGVGLSNAAGPRPLSLPA